MTSTLVFTFAVALLSIATIFSFPLEPDFSSTALPVHTVEGHLPRAFTNEFELFTSTLHMPLAERDVLPEEQFEQTSTEGEQTKRNFDETDPAEIDSTATESSLVEERAVPNLLVKPNPPLIVRKHEEEETEEEEEERTTKKPVKTTTKDESSEELTTLSGRLAEFDPTVFDSVSTPVGNQLQFDENHQSIDRLTTEEPMKTTETSIEEENKEKRVTLNQLNQGQNSALVEEKKSNH